MEKNFRVLRDAICLDDDSNQNTSVLSECSRKMLIEEFERRNQAFFRFPQNVMIEKNDRFIETLLNINKNPDMIRNRNYLDVISLVSKAGSDIGEFCNIAEKILKSTTTPPLPTTTPPSATVRNEKILDDTLQDLLDPRSDSSRSSRK